MKPDLEAIRERCEAATPGPWKVSTHQSGTINVIYREGDCWNEHGPGMLFSPITLYNMGTFSEGLTDDGVQLERHRIATFVAHARTDVEELLAWGEGLERQSDSATHDKQVYLKKWTETERERDEAQARVSELGRMLFQAETRVAELEDAVEMARADANAVPMGGAELMYELGQERVARKKAEAEVERLQALARSVEENSRRCGDSVICDAIDAMLYPTTMMAAEIIKAKQEARSDD